MINLSTSLIIFGAHLYIDFQEQEANEETLVANKQFLMKHLVFLSLFIFSFFHYLLISFILFIFT